MKPSPLFDDIGRGVCPKCGETNLTPYWIKTEKLKGKDWVCEDCGVKGIDILQMNSTDEKKSKDDSIAKE